ncbi:MAG TPA: SLBB domain-containing protein [bacterium]|nr:SLBB domain-containing protein [bacterium]
MNRLTRPFIKWALILVIFATAQPWALPTLSWAQQTDDDQRTSSLPIPSLNTDLSGQGAEALQESMREGLMSAGEDIAFAGPVDPQRYIVGVGDRFVLHFWGEKNESVPLIVSPEGFLFVPNIGTIRVADKPLAQVKAEVGDKVRRIYRNLSFELFLQTPRKFKVQVIGLVKNPGAYVADPTIRLAEILREAGGFVERGSERRIEIRHRDGTRAFGDLVRWRRTGEDVKNPTLRDGDVILVPPIETLVHLRGTTVKRGAYELLDGEDLHDVVFWLGLGLTSETSFQDEAQIVRIGDDERRRVIVFDLAKLREDRAYARGFALRDGDIVSIPSIALIQNIVLVRGAIFGVGEESLAKRSRMETEGPLLETTDTFELREGEKVYDVLQKTGGVTPWADLTNCYIERSVAGQAEPRIINIDLNKMLIARDFTDNIPLMPGDILNIPSKIDRVFVIGEVAVRGSQEYLANHPAHEYVGRAGGPTARASMWRAKVIRRNGTELDYDPQMVIQPGDTILVPETRMKWWQDYWTILIGAATLALAGFTAYNTSK